jgi:RNA polymerase sigma-70 factor, ECF subfamily
MPPIPFRPPKPSWKPWSAAPACSAPLEALPADQRRAILLRFAHQKSVREIAAALGRSQGAVKQLQFRALENLRARMEEAHG